MESWFSSSFTQSLRPTPTKLTTRVWAEMACGQEARRILQGEAALELYEVSQTPRSAKNKLIAFAA